MVTWTQALQFEGATQLDAYGTPLLSPQGAEVVP